MDALILPPHRPGRPPAVAADWFRGREARSASRDLVKGAPCYELPEHARVVVDAALALGEPLLVTGEPGTGKTQLAYYLAWALGQGEPLHFQVQSDSAARDLRYRFDDVAYFHAASHREREPSKKDFVQPEVLWQALDLARRKGAPQVLLIDEIDKAGRDFPNDLLRDLDQYRWQVPELGTTVGLEPDEADLRPVVVVTSNLERELPGPFLRRCLFLHLPFDREVIDRALAARSAELGEPGQGFLELAVTQFMRVRDLATRKKPSTSEAIVWLRALRLGGIDQRQLQGQLKDTPYLELLVKSLDDLERVRRSG